MVKINLNSDLGESFGQYIIGNDDVMFDHIVSANIACGFHAGDPVVMQRTVERALEKQIELGAHPGLPDLSGFGRRNLDISPEEAKAVVTYQIGALLGFIKAKGGKLHHVKPHGALYNMAASDKLLAQAIAEAVYEIDSDLVLVGLAGSALVEAGKNIGLKTASEVFADRTYTNEGKLVSRKEKNSMIHDKEQAVKQVLQIILDGYVTAIDGTRVEIEADTICIHGDTAESIEFAIHLRQALAKHNISLSTLN